MPRDGFRVRRMSPGVFPKRNYTGRLRPKGVPFLRLQEYEKVGKSVISICKKT